MKHYSVNVNLVLMYMGNICLAMSSLVLLVSIAPGRSILLCRLLLWYNST